MLGSLRLLGVIHLSTCIPLFLIPIFGPIVAGQGPDFGSLPRNARVRSGSTVAFQCTVIDKGNHNVSWWFMDHNVQISRNTDILVKDNENQHYQIIRPPGTDEVWSLQISDVTDADQGHYQCRIDGTVPILSQVSVLYITDSVSPLRPAQFERVNYTDCCVREGVSAACLPACYPALTPASFDSDLCAADLLKLIKCGSDGRNHAPCCHRRLLPSICLDFCRNDPPAVIDGTYNSCLHNIEDIILCYEEGQKLLPGPPEKLELFRATDSTLTVSWSSPLENAETVTGYRVFYKKHTGEQHYTSTSPSTETAKAIIELEPNTRYDIYVIAINAHGASLRSYVLTASTSQGGPYVIGSSETLLDCCERRGVSSVCRPLLCGVPIGTYNDSLAIQCLSHYDKVSACLVGERNHSACCRARNIPERCQPVCSGQGFTNYSQIDCVTTLMPEISSCFIENKDKIPGPPSGLYLDRISSSSIHVSWQEPTSHAEKVDNYVLMYRKADNSQYTERVLSKSVKDYTLTGLDHSTYYDIQIAANNSMGSSLPSPTITALTLHTDEIAVFWTPSDAPSTPEWLDPQECCQDKGIQSSCRSLCAYETDFSTISQTQALVCAQEIPQIIACGSNGRNHTQCCANRQVPSGCYVFCSLTHEQAEYFSIGIEHIACVYSISDIVSCMRDGQVFIPSPPRNLTVISRGTNTITVGWSQPSNFPNIGSRYYIVRHKEKYAEYWTTSKFTTDKGQTSIIQNLKPDTDYLIQVMAENGNSSSLPSTTQVVRTLPLNGSSIPPLLPNSPVTLPGNISNCCTNLGVSQACLPACRGQRINPLQCGNDLTSLLQCSADGRNHTVCCNRLEIPEVCLPMCVGQQVNNTVAGTICLTFTDQLLTCFHEGQRTLPGIPKDFTADVPGQTSITLRWDPPSVNANNVRYVIYYEEVDNRDARHGPVLVAQSPYTINQLKENTYYQFFIYAENEYGTSQPASFWTRTRSQQSGVQIFQVPPGYLRVGQNATLTCVAIGVSNPDYSWKLPNDTIKKGSQLFVPFLTPRDLGAFQCTDETSGRTSETFYLKVQSRPSVTPFASIVYAQADQGDSAFLMCQFLGYPDKLAWQKDGVELTTGSTSRYRAFAKENEPNHIIESGLEIQSVRQSDFGYYTCSGTNSVGPATARIQLNDASLPRPTIPPIDVGQAVPNVTACCIERGVMPECRHACSWEVQISKFYEMDNPLTCLSDINHLVECAADGKNHTACCRNNNVPPACLSFCGGTVPPLRADHLICLQNVNVILMCMQQGHQKIPGAPLDVQAQLSDDGYIHVWWNPPQINTFAVDSYIVYYSTKLFGLKYKDLRKTHLSYTIEGVHSNMLYMVYVKAGNHYGNSDKSNVVTISTHEFKPSAPLNLRSHFVGKPGTLVRLDWDDPEQHAGAVQTYIVYYRVSGTKDYESVHTEDYENTYRLDLNPNEHYQIYVTAKSSNYESEKSNTIYVKTGDIILPQATKEDSSDDSNAKGIGLGLFFGLIIVIAIIAIFAFWYLRVRKPKRQFEDSVAFENPGYATASDGPTVRGIPNGHFKETDEDNNYGYNQGIDAETIPNKNGNITTTEGATNPVYAAMNEKSVDTDHVDIDINKSSAS